MSAFSRSQDPQPTLILRREVKQRADGSDPERGQHVTLLSAVRKDRRHLCRRFVLRKQIDRQQRGSLLDRSIMFYDCRNCAHLCCINGARPTFGASMSVVLQSFLSGTWQRVKGRRLSSWPKTLSKKHQLRGKVMHIQYLIAVCLGLCALAGNAISQTAPRPFAPSANPDETWSIPDRNRINEGTVTLITAPAGGATSVFGSDMSRVLDDDATVRVLTVLGKGPVRNVIDVLYLKSIDMGIVTSDVPDSSSCSTTFQTSRRDLGISPCSTLMRFTSSRVRP